VARTICLKQLEAVVPHQCGDHSKCQHERWCTFLKEKIKHPTWTDVEIAEEAALTSSRPHGGKNMSLSDAGIEKLTSKILSRFNSKTIDKIAGGGCSNLSENFWGVTTKFSEGKRLNLDHTDAYISCNKLTFCRIGEGNIEKTHDNVSARLGLSVTSPESTYLGIAAKKRSREKIRQTSARYKQSRTFAKLSKDHRMGKVDAKSLHRSGKVLLTECAKSSVGINKKLDPKKPPTCSICKGTGHRSNACKLPLDNKRRVAELVDISVECLHVVDTCVIRASKRRKPMDLVPIDDWI